MAGRQRLEWLAIGTLAAIAFLIETKADKQTERQAGHGAAGPTQIPAKGWKEIAKRVAKAFSDNRIMANAAGVTFYSILAIFPALGALVSLYGLFSTPSAVEQQVKSLGGIIPEGGLQIITEELHSLATGNNGALSFGLIFGLLVALWSANSGVKALFDALNVVHRVPEGRSFIKLTLVSLTFTLGGLAFILIAMAAVVVLPAVLNFVGFGGALDTLLKLARWPILLIVIGLFLAVIYRYGPSRQAPRWRWVTPGSGFAAVAWVILSVLFSWYVTNFGTYNKTYGSLGAVIGFMTWIWLSTTIVLIGGAVNFETEEQAGHAIRPKS